MFSIKEATLHIVLVVTYTVFSLGLFLGAAFAILPFLRLIRLQCSSITCCQVIPVNMYGDIFNRQFLKVQILSALWYPLRDFPELHILRLTARTARRL